MKFVALFFIVVVCFFLDHAQAQCPNTPRRPNCQSPIVRGNSGRGCQAGARWGFNGRQCVRYQYRGCAGNSNRFCNLAACRQTCQRSG